MYTASRMLFVLAARREAPPQLVSVTRRGVPAVSILTSSIVGLLCVIATAFAEKSIFAFLLNSSGAIILFVYLLIVISHIVLRYRTPGRRTQGQDVAVPGAVADHRCGNHFDPGADVPAAGRALPTGAEPAVMGGRDRAVLRQPVVHQQPPGTGRVAATAPPHRVLVLANEVVDSTELLEKLREIGADRETAFQVVVPASPVETGVAATHGPLDVWDATVAAAQERLDNTLNTLRAEGFSAEGTLVTTGHCAHWPPASSRSTPTRS